MSLFEDKSIGDKCNDGIYLEIKRQLDEMMDNWKPSSPTSIFWGIDDGKEVHRISDIVLQFVWRKLGKKLPDLTRRSLDDDFNIMEYKQGNEDNQ